MLSVKCTTRVLVGLFVVATLYSANLDYAHEMCTCTCPDPTIIRSTKVMYDYVSADKCGCNELVLPRIGHLITGSKLMYCKACECIFEKEHISVASVVVYIECQFICGMIMVILYRHLIFNVWFPNPNQQLDDEEEDMLLEMDVLENN